VTSRTLHPCTGVCSTRDGDEFCRGCGRSAVEVLNWHSYTKDGRARALLRCKVRLDEMDRQDQENQ